jgi:dolichol-phosphate mannosyltransferase
MIEGKTIAVIIPAYNVGEIIIKVINKVPHFVDHIFVVDDACPLMTGSIVMRSNLIDQRVKVFFNNKNIGVGGSTKVGFQESLKLNIDIIIKIDGDDQMDSEDLIHFVNTLKNNIFDYAKGNRFLKKNYIENYPLARFYGNIILSFLTKLSSGYWDIFDPINGFIAIKSTTLKKIDIQNLDNKYFFETDLLFNLNVLNFKVKDIPVNIKYNDNQVQNLSVLREIPNFFCKNIIRFFKRINQKYLTNNFTITSLFSFFFIINLIAVMFYSVPNFIYYSLLKKTFAPTGIIMFSGLFLILCVLSFLIFCILDSNENPNKK